MLAVRMDCKRDEMKVGLTVDLKEVLWVDMLALRMDCKRDEMKVGSTVDLKEVLWVDMLDS
jgi:hypothetical protein